MDGSLRLIACANCRHCSALLWRPSPFCCGLASLSRHGLRRGCGPRVWALGHAPRSGRLALGPFGFRLAPRSGRWPDFAAASAAPSPAAGLTVLRTRFGALGSSAVTVSRSAPPSGSVASRQMPARPPSASNSCSPGPRRLRRRRRDRRLPCSASASAGAAGRTEAGWWCAQSICTTVLSPMPISDSAERSMTNCDTCKFSSAVTVIGIR